MLSESICPVRKTTDCSFQFRNLDAYQALWRLCRRDGLQLLGKVVQVENLYLPVGVQTIPRQRSRRRGVGTRTCLPLLQEHLCWLPHSQVNTYSAEQQLWA